jgi:hypothetical protein
LVTVVVLVGVLVGGGIWWLFFRGPSSAACAPVREMLSYNKSQIDALNAKTKIPEKGSFDQGTEPSEIDYRSWVDGLTDRANKVTDSELAQQAQAAAETANRLVRARLDYTAQASTTAPGGPMPPAAMAVKTFNDEFEARISQLTEKCPG